MKESVEWESLKRLISNFVKGFKKLSTGLQVFIIAGVFIFCIVLIISYDSKKVGKNSSAWKNNVERSIEKDLFPKSVKDVVISGNLIEVHLYKYDVLSYSDAVICIKEFSGVQQANGGDGSVTGVIYEDKTIMKQIEWSRNGLVE